MSSSTALDLFHHKSSTGASGLVEAFVGETAIIQRLNELGVQVGVSLEAYGRAPFGGPCLFRVGNTVLALRTEEAACIRIQKI